MKNITIWFITVASNFSFSQEIDSTKNINHFAGAVSVTTKGISTIPTFTLGKPAVIFDMSMGTRNLRFEPQFPAFNIVNPHQNHSDQYFGKSKLSLECNFDLLFQ